MKTLVCVVFSVASALAQDLAIQPENSTSGGNSSIAQGILGFGIPSSSGAPEPCVGIGTAGSCYGVPAGLLVVPTKLLVPPGTTGVYYLSIETADFAGIADTTFELFESRNLVLQLMVNGSAINANTKTIIAQAGSIPAGSYEGQATLTAATTVMPQGGGTPVTLTASTQLFILPLPSAGIDEDPSITGGAKPRMASRIATFAEDFGVPAGTYAGPATVIATTTLTTHDGDLITVKGGVTLQIIQ